MVPGDAGGDAARTPRPAAARAARSRLVGAHMGGTAIVAAASPLGAVHLPRDRHGGRKDVSRSAGQIRNDAAGGGRHLLAINFRDPAHPEAGGAELHLEHILRRAVARGWRVTWLAAGFRGGEPESQLEGVRIVRRGSWWNFNVMVPGVLRREFSAPAPDLVVEDIN